MLHQLAIAALTVIFDAVFTAAVVIPLGWHAMTPVVEAGIIITSISLAVIAVRLGQANTR